jgi:hypothetical protein
MAGSILDVEIIKFNHVWKLQEQSQQNHEGKISLYSLAFGLCLLFIGELSNGSDDNPYKITNTHGSVARGHLYLLHLDGNLTIRTMEQQLIPCTN